MKVGMKMLNEKGVTIEPSAMPIATVLAVNVRLLLTYLQ